MSKKNKTVLKLDYRSRAKRIDDEVRLLKKYDQVAKERVRRSFLSMRLYETQWCWSWDEEFYPVYIKGRCIGNQIKILGEIERFEYDHPVTPYFLQNKKEGTTRIGLFCAQDGFSPHEKVRATFEFYYSHSKDETAEDVLDTFLEKAILEERDRKIAIEIRNLRWQFWR